MKKCLSVLLVLAMALTLFAACGAEPAPTEAPAETNAPAAQETEAPAEKPEEPVTVKFATWDYSTNAQGQALIDDFTSKHPNIQVEVIDIPAADYNTKLAVMLNGGSDVDVYSVKDAGFLCDLQKKGQCAPLDEYIAANQVDTSIYNGICESYTIDGKLYALPSNSTFYMLYFNKDLFDKAGKPYPTNDMTWEDFEKLAIEMTSGSGTEKVYGALLHTWPALVQNWGVQDGKHTILDYETGYDFFKPYYEMALRLQDAGAIQGYGELKSANIHYSGAFGTGNVAMMPMGNWFTGNLINNINEGKTNFTNWGVATIPHPADVEEGYTVGSTTPLCINNASEKKDAAWELMAYYCGEDGQKYSASMGSMPSILNEETAALFASAEGMPEEMATVLSDVTNLVPDRPIADNVTEINDMLGEEHGMIMLGECTIEEGLKTMSERAAEILK